MATEPEEFEVRADTSPEDKTSLDTTPVDTGPVDTTPLEMPEDSRLSSGVPVEARADELDFIEMTGLTRPGGMAAGDADSDPDSNSDPDLDAEAGSAPASGSPAAKSSEPAPARAPAVEAADDLDEDDEPEEDDALARALEALSAVPEPVGTQAPPPDVESLVSKMRDEILDGLREDISSRQAAPAPLHAPVNPTLREAERLVQELQEQPRDPEPPPQVEDAVPPGGTQETEVEGEPRQAERRTVSRLYAERQRDVEGYLAAYTGEPTRPESDEPEVEVDFSNDPPKHRHRTMSKRQRNMRRFLIGAMAIVVLAAAGYIGYQYAEPYLQTAGTLFREAEQLETNGLAREASNRYRAFLARYPNDPRAPEALFRAGFVLQVEEAAAVSPRALADSLNLFDRFIEHYPEHDKSHRARTLRGILLYRMGDHEAAVSTLRDPSLQLADPAAALPMWRTLARAYQALGDTASARSEYLKAASFQGNYNADEDFEALGRMYKRLAEGAGDSAARAEHLREGISYLQQAALVPGVSRDRQQALQREIEFLRREFDEHAGESVQRTARAAGQAPHWLSQKAAGDPTEPALDPAEFLSILDGMAGTLPMAGVSADPALDSELDAAGDEPAGHAAQPAANEAVEQP